MIGNMNPIEEFAADLKKVPQPERWHAEGDVLTHTNMVVEELQLIQAYNELGKDAQEILSLAAYLHDIGKIRQTRIINGEIEAPHHAAAGSRMARAYLWKSLNLSGAHEKMIMRESIALLIRYHSLPPHAIEMPDVKLRLHKIASNGLLSADFSIRLLCILAKADMLGRICEDKEQMLDQIALCEELAKEEQCFDSCYRFPSDFTMRSYLNGRDVWKEQRLYDDTWGTVYLMSGLPGTGKDTWIEQNLPDIPMVSLDELRRRYKVSPLANQGYIANLAKEQAKEYLRRHQPFVWNATNITQEMRQQLVALFEGYKARVNIIYLETDWQTLLERNRSREDAVPQSAIEAMLGKLTPPEACEAAQVNWISV